MTVKSFITGIYRLCLLSLARLAVDATLITNPDTFSYADKALITVLFITGAVFVIFGIAVEGKRE